MSERSADWARVEMAFPPHPADEGAGRRTVWLVAERTGAVSLGTAAPETLVFRAVGEADRRPLLRLPARQAQALAVALHAAVDRPPLLPPLTGVQRAWVVGMAEAEGVAGRGPRRINWVAWTVWASRRWGKRRAAMLRSLSSAVSHWRLEQEVARINSGPQDAPGSARGCETPGRGPSSRGGPFPLTRAGVLYGQEDAELLRRDMDGLKADFAAVLADLAAARDQAEGGGS